MVTKHIQGKVVFSEISTALFTPLISLSESYHGREEGSREEGGRKATKRSIIFDLQIAPKAEQQCVW